MATIGYLVGGISRAGDEAVNASGEAARGLLNSRARGKKISLKYRSLPSSTS